MGKSIYMSSQIHDSSTFNDYPPNNVQLRKASFVPDGISEDLNDSDPEVSAFIEKDALNEENIVEKPSQIPQSEDEFAAITNSYCVKDFSENFSKINSIRKLVKK